MHGAVLQVRAHVRTVGWHCARRSIRSPEDHQRLIGQIKAEHAAGFESARAGREKPTIEGQGFVPFQFHSATSLNFKRPANP